MSRNIDSSRLSIDDEKLATGFVRELFDYSPETGDLIWKVRKGRVKAGDIAGTISSRGYVITSINRKRYRVHNLIWAWHRGKWPRLEIDHIDRNKLNNRIENLRDVTHRANMLNSTRSGVSGINGVQVYFNRFRARIFDPNLQKTVHIGSYKTAEEAEYAYRMRHQESYGIDSIYFSAYHHPSPRLIAASAEVFSKRFSQC